MIHTYFIQAVGGGLIKIGQATSLPRRLLCLQCGSPVPLVLLGSLDAAIYPERSLHRQFADDRSHGEWFRPSTELIAFLAAHGIRARKTDLSTRPIKYNGPTPVEINENLLDLSHNELGSIRKNPFLSRLYLSMVRAYTKKCQELAQKNKDVA